MLDINPSLPEQHQSTEKTMNLSEFARHNQITEDRVWELIEEGELAARFVNDEILILREIEAASEAQEPSIDIVHVAEIPIEVEAATSKHIQPHPESPTEIDFTDNCREGENSRDLDLPSNDNHDLLMFAQDAMNRTMDLSGQLLATKDELIRLKNETILQQKTELDKQSLAILRLKKKLEDMETLCRLNLIG